jgi:DNA-binding NarL/FixJ family response regulator
MAIRVLIVDDQPLIRRGMSLMLNAEPDIEVVGQASDGAEAVALSESLHPDVVLMDLHMPVMDGVRATREITKAQNGVRIMVLTTFDADDLVFEAIRAGAQAYLLKDTGESEVLDTIRAVHRGESRPAPDIARKVIEQFRLLAERNDDREAHPGETEVRGAPEVAALPSEPREMSEAAASGPLTAKEERILELIAEGRSNKDIARLVFLAEGTVKNYVSRIMEKLHARTRTELAVRTLRNRRA